MRYRYKALLVAVFTLGLVMSPAVADESPAEGNKWAGTWHFDQLAELTSNPCVPEEGGACTKTVTGIFTGSYSGSHATGGKNIPWSALFNVPGSATLNYSGSQASGEIVFGGGEWTSNEAFGAYANVALLPAGIVRVYGKLNLAAGADTVTATGFLLKVYVLGAVQSWVTVVDESYNTPA